MAFGREVSQRAEGLLPYGFGPSGGPNSVQLDAITAPSRAARSGGWVVGSKSLLV